MRSGQFVTGKTAGVCPRRFFRENTTELRAIGFRFLPLFVIMTLAKNDVRAFGNQRADAIRRRFREISRAPIRRLTGGSKSDAAESRVPRPDLPRRVPLPGPWCRHER